MTTMTIGVAHKMMDDIIKSQHPTLHLWKEVMQDGCYASANLTEIENARKAMAYMSSWMQRELDKDTLKFMTPIQAAIARYLNDRTPTTDDMFAADQLVRMICYFLIDNGLWEEEKHRDALENASEEAEAAKASEAEAKPSETDTKAPAGKA